jgi:ABC-2 type transport system ATP-binding protein
MSSVETPVVLRAAGLRRRFGKVEAVRDVSLTLRAGQVYGFLGRNGAGKTTTLRMLMGVLRPDQGEIELLGERGDRVKASQRVRVGYVSQEQVFYPWMTARELGHFAAGFYPTWDDAEFTRLLTRLDVPPERKTQQLSGGTRAKLGLALALAHRPPLLVMDEPTSGLDPVARRELLDLLKDRNGREQQAVIFSSHLVSEVEQVCDQIGILDGGVVRYEGPLTTLRREHRKIKVGGVVPALPPEAELLRAEPHLDGTSHWVVRAPESLWSSGQFGDPPPQPLSLESVFLAYALRTPASASAAEPEP